MSLESFYGGKQGISPVIQKTFKYIDTADPAYAAALAAGKTATQLASQTMDICFGKANYEEVWYGELCIIDATNKNNPNHGKLFRRTLKGAGDSGENLCAEYVGHIVGPSGGSPFVSLGSISSVNEQAHSDYIAHDSAEVAYPISQNGVSHERPADNVNPYVFSATQGNNMLVPGKTSGGVYNDDIKYTWFNIRNNVNDSPTDSWVYLGMRIPYPSFDMTATAIDWDLDSNLTKTSNDDHPFYHSWHINIPRGARGNAAHNVRLAQYKDFKNLSGDSSKPFLYDFTEGVQENSSRRGSYTVSQVTPEPFRDLTAAQKTALQDSYIFVYDYTFYDKQTGSSATINKYTFFLGLYKEVSNIVLEDDGTIKINYSDTTDNTFSQKIKWINDVIISTSGLLTVSFNNGADAKSWQLPYPEKISVTDDGEISVTYKNGQNIPITLERSGTSFSINYVDSINIDENSKVINYTTYPNNGVGILNQGEGLNYVKAMVTDEKNHLLVFYASDQKRLTSEDIGAGTKDGLQVEDITNTSENYNRAKWKNQEFRNGIVYEGIAQTEYWHDLGPMRLIDEGVRVATEIHWDSHPYADIISGMDIPSFIENVLNPEYWDENNTIKNPYFAGDIPGTRPDGVSLRGSFIYTPYLLTGVAFYYDYDSQSWTYAGEWGSNSQTDIKVQYPDNHYTNDVDESPSAVTLVMTDIGQEFTPELPILW